MNKSFGQFCVPAIIRSDKQNFYNIGLEVLVTAKSAKLYYKTPVMYWAEGMERCEWASQGQLLLRSDYLRRQPKDVFWVLTVAQSVEGRLAYLTDPWQHRNGDIPFHFESEGELRYYIRENKISKDSYVLGAFRWI